MRKDIYICFRDFRVIIINNLINIVCAIYKQHETETKLHLLISRFILAWVKNAGRPICTCFLILSFKLKLYCYSVDDKEASSPAKRGLESTSDLDDISHAKRQKTRAQESNENMGEDTCIDNVDVILEGKELWDRFNELGTEMIITKAGR